MPPICLLLLGFIFVSFGGGSNKQSNVFRNTRRLPPPTTLSRHTTHDSRRQRRRFTFRAAFRDWLPTRPAVVQELNSTWVQLQEKTSPLSKPQQRERKRASEPENVNTKSSKTKYSQRLRLWIVHSLSAALTCALSPGHSCSPALGSTKHVERMYLSRR